MADYWERIRDQTEVYDTVTADEGPFIKVMNVGERIEVNRIEGGLQSRQTTLVYLQLLKDTFKRDAASS